MYTHTLVARFLFIHSLARSTCFYHFIVTLHGSSRASFPTFTNLYSTYSTYNPDLLAPFVFSSNATPFIHAYPSSNFHRNIDFAASRIATDTRH